MLDILLVASSEDKEYMANFIEFVSEALVGWEPFVNDTFTISPMMEKNGKCVTRITAGNENAEMLHKVAIRYSPNIFFGKEESWRIGKEFGIE